MSRGLPLTNFLSASASGIAGLVAKGVIMKINLRNILWVQVACLCLCPAFLSAQTADLNKGPAVCSSNTEVCEQSKMIQSSASQSKAETADHQYNVAACR